MSMTTIPLRLPRGLSALLAVPILGLLLSQPFAYADSLSMENTAVTPYSSARYWTPMRFRNAQPMPLPRPTSGAGTDTPLQIFSHDAAESGTVVTGRGRGPSVRVRPDLTHRLYTPLEQPAAAFAESETEDAPVEEDPVSPHDAGTAGAHYSSQRLVPLAADRVYPYRAAGKLFFTIPGVGDASCSAAVLRPRVILTAGHCVHSGSGGASGFFTNFLFVPAYRNGIAPYGTWNWSRVVVTGPWAAGGGLVPNAADYAIIELQDQVMNAVLRRIGEVTGYFGYQTASLLPNHAHLLGYPVNFDRGEIVHQVTAQSFRATASNTVEYGSNMRNGSSGGPWVQNFAGPCSGANCGVNTVANAIVGVTSYGPISTAPKYQGSSVLDNNFLNILNLACSWQAGNC